MKTLPQFRSPSLFSSSNRLAQEKKNTSLTLHNHLNFSALDLRMTGGGRRSTRSRAKSATDVNEDDDALLKTKPISKLRRVKAKDHGNSLRILNANLKILLGVGIVAALLIFFFVNHLISPAEEAPRPRVITPLPAPKIMDLPQVVFIFFSIQRF